MHTENERDEVPKEEGGSGRSSLRVSAFAAAAAPAAAGADAAAAA